MVFIFKKIFVCFNIIGLIVFLYYFYLSNVVLQSKLALFKKKNHIYFLYNFIVIMLIIVSF